GSCAPPCWPLTTRVPTIAFRALSKFFGAGIHHLPELRPVLQAFHLWCQSTLTRDPVLHALRIIGHEIGGAGRARNPHAHGPVLVEISFVKAEAGARRDANAVQRHDAEHKRAGRIADAVDDHALAGIADLGVAGLVFIDPAAV